MAAHHDFAGHGSHGANVTAHPRTFVRFGMPTHGGAQPVASCAVTGVEIRGASCTTVGGALLILVGVLLLLAAHALRRSPSRRPYAKLKPTPERPRGTAECHDGDHARDAASVFSVPPEFAAALRHRGSPGASLRSHDGNGSGESPTPGTPGDATPRRRSTVTIAGADSFWTVTSDGVSTLHKYRRDSLLDVARQ